MGDSGDGSGEAVDGDGGFPEAEEVEEERGVLEEFGGEAEGTELAAAVDDAGGGGVEEFAGRV